MTRQIQLFQILLVILIALLVFRGGAFATRLLTNAKEAKKEFERTVDPVKHAKPVQAAKTKTEAREPDEIS